MGRPKKLYSRDGYTLGTREGHAVVEIVEPGTGARSRVRLGVPYADKEAAQRAFDDFVDGCLAARTERPTVAALWDLWQRDKALDGYPVDWNGYQWRALAPHFGHRDPLTLQAEDFRAYARARFSIGRAENSVYNELASLRRALRWAYENDHVPKLVKVWTPSRGEGRDRVLTIEEARRIVTTAQTREQHILLFTVLLFATSARHTAILELTWDRIDFDAGTINLNAERKRDPMAKAYKKGRSIVPMNRAARAALLDAYERRTCAHVVAWRGQPLQRARKGFTSLIKAAGLWDEENRITPHVVRHTVATWLNERGGEVQRTAQLLGHKDERTTRMIYTHASADMLNDAVAELDDAFMPMAEIAFIEDKLQPQED